MSVVCDNFLRYVAVDTQSELNRDTVPSTEKQFRLARMLKQELADMGASDVKMDEHGYVYAVIPSTTEKKVPSIGFIAHMDTSNALSGENVHARIVSDYNGAPIPLHKEYGYVLDPKEYPSLLSYIGKDLVVTDGTTLLGADDKAGVAEIMAAAMYLLEHPEIPHGSISIGFTPDEEVGRGVDFFDVQGFGADFAYTVDGGELGELEYENFNAVNYEVEIMGTSIHPGSAKGKMKNALLIGMELQNLLPTFENPAYTEGYEGFYHLTDMGGDCDYVRMEYIIRDHDREKFEKKISFFQSCAEFLNKKYGSDTVRLKEQISYYNMKKQIEPHMHLITNAKAAMEELGIEPKIVPIRGGTDGARLSYMGLPCPNLCTGGANFHGRYEYICIQSMESCVQVILKIIERYAGAGKELYNKLVLPNKTI